MIILKLKLFGTLVARDVVVSLRRFLTEKTLSLVGPKMALTFVRFTINF